MEAKTNNWIEVDYELFVPNDMGNRDLIEKTSKGHPFNFISGLGFSLEAFEDKIIGLHAGDDFDFVISVTEAYGEYADEHVIRLNKEIFNVNGHFDEARIYPGNVVPLANEDGNRFDGIVKEVQADVVIMDLNHPLAGKPLHFKGRVVANRPATTHEIETFVNQMNGEEDCDCCEKHDKCQSDGGCEHEYCCHCGKEKE